MVIKEAVLNDLINLLTNGNMPLTNAVLVVNVKYGIVIPYETARSAVSKRLMCLPVVRRPILSDWHRKERVDFCVLMLQNPALFRATVFTDESTFRVLSLATGHKVWVESRHDPRRYVGKHSQAPFSIMAFGAIQIDLGGSDLYMFRGPEDGAEYLQVRLVAYKLAGPCFCGDVVCIRGA
jgi:hypothetical protein